MFSVEEQVALARQYPFGQLRLIENVGHALHWEQPEVFVRELLRFMEERVPGPSRRDQT